MIHRRPRLGLLVVTCLAAATAVAARAPQEVIDAAAQAEAIGILKDLVRIDTQNPPGNESAVAHYLQDVLTREGIESEILEPVPGRGSLVARLRGNGKKRPILLLGHEDVVPVDRSRWSVDPFAAIERDGVLYGRGASDDKGAVAANLEVLLQLKRHKVRLDRDVILLAEASEEAASPAGMAVLSERYWDKIAAEYAINEGGGTLMVDGRIRYFGVGTAEKLPRGLKLVATGSSGHGSVPRVDNAIIHLARAVARVGVWETPARLNETTREYFRRLAMISPPDEAAWYRDVLSAPAQAALRVQKPEYYSMLRTSVVPTILSGGFKSNVIPPSAEATLDVRMLPDEDVAGFRSAVEAVIDDPQVKVVAEDPVYSMPPAAPTPLDTELFRALEAAQKELAPDSITLPSLLTGASNSAFLRARGVATYGIAIPKTEAEARSVHGNDERVQVASVGLFVRYLYRVVSQVAEHH